MTAIRAVRESKLEKEGTDYAESRGWFQFKIEKASKRGVPDRFYLREGRVVFIEWKRPGEEPTPQQVKRHKEIRDHGGEVHVVDSMEKLYVVLV